MYPKPVQDLHGWNLRSIGTCSIGLVAAADDSCIVWGSGTSSGELVNRNTLNINSIHKVLKPNLFKMLRVLEN